MNPDLSRSFKEIAQGLLSAQFNVEVRSARFTELLLSSLIEMLVLLIFAIVFQYEALSIVLTLGFFFIMFTLLYHMKTDVNRVDFKATFFTVVYTVFLIPSIYYFCGKDTIGPAFLQTQLYFSAFFVLKALPALLVVSLATVIWVMLFNNFDYFLAIGIKTEPMSQFGENVFLEGEPITLDVVYTIFIMFMAVCTIGSLIAKTISAYDKEQINAQRLFEDYNNTLYKRGSGNAYNDRFLLSNVGTLGVLTEKGDIPGFTAVAFSTDNIECITHLSETAKKETFEVFSRKVQKLLSEDEVFVRQEENKFILLLNTANDFEAHDKIDELLAVINMTIFQHLPKERLTLSAGYSIHTAGQSTATTMQRATENMLIAKKKGGNMSVGGNG